MKHIQIRKRQREGIDVALQNGKGFARQATNTYIEKIN